MTNVIAGMPPNDIVKFDVPAVADKNFAIAEALTKRLTAMEEGERDEVLKTKPAGSIRSFAIHEFIDSGSFDSAYANGKELILPHAKFFDLNDLKRVLEGSLKNEGWRGINQIIHAGNIDQIFISLYDQTKSILGAPEAWKAFWEGLPKHIKEHFELTNRLQDDNVIEAGEEKAAEQNDVPF